MNISDNSTATNFTNSSSLPPGKATSYCASITDECMISIGAFGSVTNLISFVVFLHPNLNATTTASSSTANANAANNSNNNIKMNKFLLFKSLCDFLLLSRFLIYNQTLCVDCPTGTFGFKLFALIYFFYLGFGSQLASMILELFVAIDRYALVSQNMKWFTKLDYKWPLLFAFSYSFLFYIFKFFELQIIKSAADSSDRFYITAAQFDVPTVKLVWGLIHTIQRDVVCVLGILVFNILLLIKMKKVMKRKKSMRSSTQTTMSLSTLTVVTMAAETTAKDSSKQHKKSTIISRSSSSSLADKAESKLAIMVVLTGSVCVFGHIGIIVAYLPIENFALDDCFTVTRDFLYFFSYAINFFFYYSFNNLFRKSFHAQCSFMINILCRLDKLARNCDRNRDCCSSQKRRQI